MDIYIDYDQVQWVFIGVFGVVGVFRGWLKELFTSFLLVLMALPLVYPSMADTIISFANGIILALERFLSAVTNSPSSDVAAFGYDNSYTLFIGVLAALVILSYMSDRIGIAQQGLTVFSALSGGLLGAFNGFMIVSLVKQYVLGRPVTDQEVQAFAPVSDVSLSIENVPPEQFLNSFGHILPILVVAGMFVVLFGRLFTVRSPISKK